VASSVAGARRFAEESLAEWTDDTVHRVDLIVSELASNCVEHARTEFTLCLHRTDDGLRGEITDGGAGLPTLRHPDTRRIKGRGLLIVEALSDAWGSVSVPGNGKTVWFTLKEKASILYSPGSGSKNG